MTPAKPYTGSSLVPTRLNCIELQRGHVAKPPTLAAPICASRASMRLRSSATSVGKGVSRFQIASVSRSSSSDFGFMPVSGGLGVAVSKDYRQAGTYVEQHAEQRAIGAAQCAHRYPFPQPRRATSPRLASAAPLGAGRRGWGDCMRGVVHGASVRAARRLNNVQVGGQ